MSGNGRRSALEPLRDVRAIAERVKKGELVAAVGDAEVAGEKVRAVERRVVAARARLEAAMADAGASGNAAAAALVMVERYVARRRRELVDVQAELARAVAERDARVGEADVARGRLAMARAEREVVERKFEAWRRERKLAAERREE